MYAWIIALLFTCASCSANEPTIQWLYPHKNPPVKTYNYLDTVYIAWRSDAQHTSLNLWCVNNKKHLYEPVLSPAQNPILVPPVGFYPLQFGKIRNVFTDGCHVGFYNMSKNNNGYSIGNSPEFYLDFKKHILPKTYGLNVAHSLTASSTVSSSTPPPTGPVHTSTTPKGYTPSQQKPHAQKGSDTTTGTLSTGAIAGIAVGAIAAALALAAAGFLMYRLRRRKIQREAGRPPYEISDISNSGIYGSRNVHFPITSGKWNSDPQEVAGDSLFPSRQLDGTPISEAPANGSPTLYLSGSFRSELP